MSKKVFIIFLLIFEVLLVHPVMCVQNYIDSHRIRPTSIPLPFHYFHIQTNNSQNDSELVKQMIMLANVTEVNLFYTNAYNKAAEDFIFTTYAYLQDKRYLDRFPIIGLQTIEEFHNSDRIFSQKDNSLQFIMDTDLPNDLTSLKNLDEPILGSLKISAKTEQSINLFVQLLSTEHPEIQLDRMDHLESALTPLPFFLEFMKKLIQNLSQIELGLYGVFSAILLYLLISISYDTRKIAISKAHGHSDGSIVLTYIKRYIPLVLLLGPLCFTGGYFLFGGKPVPLFFNTLLNFIFVLIVFSGLICLLAILAMFFIAAIQPAELVKGRKSQKILIVYTAIIKIALIVLLIPGFVFQIADFEQTRMYVKYKRMEAEVFADSYQIICPPQLMIDFNPEEFYQKAEGTGVAFSVKAQDLSDILNQEVDLVITNSQMVNHRKLKAEGKYLEISREKQYLIVSSGIDVDKIQRVLFKTEYFAQGNWKQCPPEEVETIVLDPNQTFPVQHDQLKHPNPSEFILAVNTNIPLNVNYFLYKNIDATMIAPVEELLNQGLETKVFSLKPYSPSKSGISDWLRIFRAALSCGLLLLASVLATILFHNSIIEFSKQKLIILNIHGTNLYSYIKPLAIALASNIVLGGFCWLIMRAKVDNNFLVMGTWRFVITVGLLCVLELIIWAISIRMLSKKRILILHGE